MVRHLFRTLVSPVRGLHEAAYVLAGLTLASQILALLRDRIFAHQFGAGQTLDLYYAAFKIPDLVFALIASLVSAYVLIPRIAGAKKEEARALISETTSFLIIAGGLVTLILAIFAPYFLFILFPAFAHSAGREEFILLARILLLQPILLGLSSIAMSVTQVERRFTLFAISPVLYNLGIILGAMTLYPVLGLPGIGIGVVIGAVAHLLVSVPIVIRAGVFPKFMIPSPTRMWSVMRDSLPRSLALGMGAFTTLGLTSIASYIGSGGISIFTLAGNLEAVPLSLIGASYATAAFPVLAEQKNAGQDAEFSATVAGAARQVIFLSTVFMGLVVVLRAHIVRVILGSGQFGWNDTRLTAAVLAILVVGLVAQGVILLASRAFYAAHRSWNPLIIQIVGAVISLVSALGLAALSVEVPAIRYFFESMFRVADVPGSGVLFIALGATLGQLCMLVAALITLRTVAPRVAGSLIRPLLEGLGASVLASATAYEVLSYMGNIAPLTTLLAVFTQGLIAGIVGLIVAGVVLAMLENEEFKALWSALKRVKSKVLRPSSEF